MPKKLNEQKAMNLIQIGLISLLFHFTLYLQYPLNLLTAGFQNRHKSCQNGPIPPKFGQKLVLIVFCWYFFLD